MCVCLSVCLYVWPFVCTCVCMYVRMYMHVSIASIQSLLITSILISLSVLLCMHMYFNSQLSQCLCSSIFGHQVFVCGAYPHWLFMSERGALRCHPMNIDGPVVTFSSFHNVNCKKGFLYFNNEVNDKCYH